MTSTRLAWAAAAMLTVAGCGSDSKKSADTTLPAAANISAPATRTAATVAPSTAAPQPISSTTSTTTSTTTAPTTAPPTTRSLASLAAAYTEPGPYPVGVTTMEMDSGTKIEVWYPAVDGTSGQESYDVRDFTPDGIKQLLTADIPATFSYAAGRDTPAAQGRHPLVLFSHGFSGIRLQSSFLTSHLASWGLIVAAPDHPARDLRAAVGGTVKPDPQLSIDDLLTTLEVVTGSAMLATRIDAERVIALGHSAGGGTIVGAANQSDVIDGIVSMASGFGNAESPLAPPQQPSFFLAGSADNVVSPARTAAAFATATAPSLLWTLDKVGHNGFDDFCTFGNGKGIIGIAEESGLGAFLDAQPQFRALGSDGCEPPAAPVTEGFPIIRHAVTAWIRWQTGLDPEPIGLGAEVSGEYGLGVAIESKG